MEFQILAKKLSRNLFDFHITVAHCVYSRARKNPPVELEVESSSSSLIRTFRSKKERLKRKTKSSQGDKEEKREKKGERRRGGDGAEDVAR